MTAHEIKELLSEAQRLDTDLAMSENPSRKRIDHVKQRWKAADQALEDLIADRDQLRAENLGLRSAIKDNWEKHGLRNGIPAYHCMFCNRWAFKDQQIEHASECITTLQTRREP